MNTMIHYIQSNPLLAPLAKIIIVILGVILINAFLKKVIEQSVRKVITRNRFQSEEAERKREDTLINITTKTSKLIVIIIAIMTILQTLGIPIGPVLATAGIVGVAVGFGGQYLIRDIITGLFIILENQYRVGDIICSQESCGTVEDMSLRITTLRDMDGTVHHIPHGEITKVSNLSKKYSKVNLNIGVAYDTDLSHAKEVINQLGQELANDPVWKASIIQAPEFLRVDRFADSAIELKITGETLPSKQWEVTGELRWRIKEAFENAGIDIPFPQRVVHHMDK